MVLHRNFVPCNQRRCRQNSPAFSKQANYNTQTISNPHGVLCTKMKYKWPCGPLVSTKINPLHGDYSPWNVCKFLYRWQVHPCRIPLHYFQLQGVRCKDPRTAMLPCGYTLCRRTKLLYLCYYTLQRNLPRTAGGNGCCPQLLVELQASFQLSLQ